MTIEELRERIKGLEQEARIERAKCRSSQYWDAKWAAYQAVLRLFCEHIAANKNGKKDQVADASKGILSNCCGQRAFIVGDVTKHYECEKCGSACDLQYYYHIPDTEKKVEPLCGTCGGQGGYSKGIWIQPCESCIAAGRLGMVVKALSQAVVNLQQRINKCDIL